MKKIIFILLLVFQLFFYNCVEEDKTAKEINKIAVNMQVARFDQEFAQTNSENLSAIKKEYPYLFPEQYTDSVWIAKTQDTIQQELNEEVRKAFPDFNAEKEELEELFRHIKYYYPKFKEPKVITLTSDVAYNSRVILADSILLIGLDNYLGKDHKFYAGFQNYIATGLDKQFLVSDVASEFCGQIVPRERGRTFLDQMVYYGKELYLKDKLIPFQSEAQRIVYAPEQLEWAKVNEEQIWRYYVERELLYSTDKQLQLRFLEPAPFSKFQLELIDSESPGRIGRYIGWQIVRAFMENNEVTLQQMLTIPANEIFKKSNYKPKK